MKNIKGHALSIIYALCIAFLFRSFLFEPYKVPSGSMEPNLLVGDRLFISKYSYGYSQYSLISDLIPGFNSLIKNTIGKIMPDRVFFTPPKRGDIIVFKYPKDDSINYVKRLIGLPGDKIVIIDNDLYVNGVKAIESKEGSYLYNDHFNTITLVKYNEILPQTVPHTIIRLPLDEPLKMSFKTQKFVVPEGHFFFMGDNRDFSKDSRYPEVGMVPLKNLLGRAEILFWTSKSFTDFTKLKKDPRLFKLLSHD